MLTLINDRGLCSGEGKRFQRVTVGRIQSAYGLEPRYRRLRETGMLTLEEIASQLGVCTSTVKVWRRRGLLPAHPYNDKNEYLYEPPGDQAPVKHKWKGISGKMAGRKVVSQTTNEVQCES